MFNLTFRTAKFSYLLMLAMVVPLCFEIDFILYVWLGDNVPDYTNIFSIIVLITGLVSSLHTASLMPYHAIGKLGTGNVIGGTLMFLSLPLTYILFKVGLPPYWAFIAIFITNTLQQITTWMVIHSYVRFSYWELIKKVYLPIVIVTILSVLCPLAINHVMAQGWVRLIVLIISTELVLAVIIYLIALTSSERDTIKRFVQTRVYARFKNSKR